MAKKVTYQMTQQEIKKLNIVNQAINGYMTVKEAAQALNLSERQIKRLKKGVKEKGPSFVIHKSRGKAPIHVIPEETKKQIIHLKNTKYPAANFSHFTELLNEYENISVSRPAVQKILNKAGIKSPKKHKKTKKHHTRKRKEKMGLLVQIDASPYDWLDTGFRVDLHGAIDDATGTVFALYLAENECLEGYFQIMHQTISNYGIPASLYSDKHSIFRSSKADKLSIDEQLEGKQARPTQFGRAMEELGVNIIPANSPQAKGRIERLWETLQSRLPTVFKLKDISTIEEANNFLQSEFIHDFNKKFAVKPESEISGFTNLSEHICLDYVLCTKYQRVIDNAGNFSFNGNTYQVIDNENVVTPKSKITVMNSHKIGIKVACRDSFFNVIQVTKESINRKTDKIKTNSTNPKSKNYKPENDHPWKNRDNKAYLNYDYEMSNSELLSSLYKSRGRV